MKRRVWSTGLILALAALTTPLTAGAVQVVNLNADPTPTAGGTALWITLINITDNSAAKPYLITLDPGVYDLGDTRLQLKPWVDIQGSGQGNTIIQGYGNPTPGDLLNGVLKGASSMELRNLQVKCVGGAGRVCIGLYNGLASPTLRNVTINVSGGDATWGIRNNGSSPLIEDSTIAVSGGASGYGIVNTSGSAAKPTVRRSVIGVSGASSAFGIYNDLSGMPSEVRDTKITVSGTNEAYGFYLNSSNGSNIGSLTASTLSASSATTNYGVFFGGTGTDSLTVDNSQIAASGGTSSYGLYINIAGLTLRNSTVSGATRSVKTYSNTPKIGLTQLSGAFEPSGLSACAGVYNSNLTFFAGPNCP
ncbi:MAG TPA: hypothetical protein VH988_33940 [Thermoanaerobaculia bacterium]|nr:hypothetical protein [Thermoanaerobaculia bacterium]